MSGMTVFAMTEHMPRSDEDLYPEELEAKDSAQTLEKRFDDYIAEATKLRDTYYANSDALPHSDMATTEITPSHSQITNQESGQPKMEVLIGVETEFIHPTSITILSSLLERHSSHIDFLLGSVHHVHNVPIDFDRATYLSARAACSPATDAQLFGDYFDAQYRMLQVLKPQVVGHFDLIRLLSDEPDADWKTRVSEDSQGNSIWAQIQRNLDVVKSYGGLLEVNTSAWRKGLSDPYPRREIVQMWRSMGGDVVLSDDSHSTAQVATNYHRLKAFLKECGVTRVAFLRRRNEDPASRLVIGEDGGRCLVGYVDVDSLW